MVQPASKRIVTEASTLLAGKLAAANNLSDVAAPATALANLGGVSQVVAPTGVAATDTGVIQAAMNALPATGGKIILQRGVYVINSTLTAAVPNTVLIGAGKDATIIRTTAAIRMIDSAGFDGLELRDLQVDGTGVATNIVRMYKAASIAQQMRMQHVRLMNAAPTGIVLDTTGGTNASLADCYFFDAEFNGGGTGFNLGDLDNQFYSCRFSNFTVAAWATTPGKDPGAHFYGSIWSGNAVDIQLNSAIGTTDFHGCWFENSTSSIVSVPTALASGNSMHFYNCQFHTFGANLFNLANASATSLIIWGGSFTPANGSVALLPTGCTVWIRMAANGERVTLSGAGSLLREQSPVTEPLNGLGIRGAAARLALGANPSQSGTIRMEYGGNITTRNVANSGDTVLLASDANGQVLIDTLGQGTVLGQHLKFSNAAERQALGGGVAPTLGTIGGTGPATAAQNGWLIVFIGGTPYYIPIWT